MLRHLIDPRELLLSRLSRPRALVVVIALCAVAVEGTIKLREVRVGVQDMATETTERNGHTAAESPKSSASG